MNVIAAAEGCCHFGFLGSVLLCAARGAREELHQHLGNEFESVLAVSSGATESLGFRVYDY